MLNYIVATNFVQLNWSTVAYSRECSWPAQQRRVPWLSRSRSGEKIWP